MDEIKVGMMFRDNQKTKCRIVNVFTDDEEMIVTYKYWLPHKRRWQFKTEYAEVFLIGFSHGPWTWIKTK
jgi:hypothetical protein